MAKQNILEFEEEDAQGILLFTVVGHSLACFQSGRDCC